MNFLTKYIKNLVSDNNFIIRSDGSAITYSQMNALSAQFANTLIEQGVQKGDRVMMYTEKSAEAFIVYIACLRAGFVLIPINPAYTKSELEYFIQDSKPKVVVVDLGKEELVRSMVRKFDLSVETLGIDGNSGTFLEKAKKKSDYFENTECKDDDLAAIVYTSGTTGKPKGAMITHRNLCSNAETLCKVWKFSQSDILLHVLPIFHVHGLFVATNVTLVAGSSMIFLQKFDVDGVIKNISDATVMMGIPTYYTLLMQDERLKPNLVKHVRLFISGSAPLLAEIHEEWFKRTGHMMLERYGMTETGMITSNPYNGDRIPGTVGFPLPGISVRITDQSSGDKLPVGEIGLIEVKGPNVFKGYWRAHKKTKVAFRSDGFFITGDLGFIDQKGYLHIVGRQKDLIITCGLNVYPKEVEDRLNKIPGVIEGAVIGVPHHDFGEGIIAIVAMKQNVHLTEHELLADLKRSLAQYKLPLKIIFTDVLPRNTMGKVQKSVLRSTYLNIFK